MAQILTLSHPIATAKNERKSEKLCGIITSPSEILQQKTQEPNAIPKVPAVRCRPRKTLSEGVNKCNRNLRTSTRTHFNAKAPLSACSSTSVQVQSLKLNTTSNDQRNLSLRSVHFHGRTRVGWGIIQVRVTRVPLVVRIWSISLVTLVTCM